ncbi:tryptophan synthase subunit alpha, partial [Staphylococcus aureus]|uniref:tryptophan synthase subunit alpha n=1 Tax=Staphylococcus aureus TaxID=1280 RepID=UPI00119F9888
EKHRHQINSNYLLITYYNIISHYQQQPFFQKCPHTPVYPLIIPHLPYQLSHPLKQQFTHYPLKIMSLLPITTDHKPIKHILSHPQRFIYTLTINPTTPQNPPFHPELKPKIHSIKPIPNLPLLPPFPITTPQHLPHIKHLPHPILIATQILKRFKSNTRDEIITYLQ